MDTTLTRPSTPFESNPPPMSTQHRPERSDSRLTASVRSEWIKLATVRAPRAILALTILVGGAASFMVARFVDEPDLSVANVFGFSAVFTAVFAAVSGILAYTTEAEHHTTHQTFAAQPHRIIVVAAKAITTVGYTALLCLAGLAAGAVGAALGGVEAGDTSTVPAMIGWATGFAVLAGTLGLGVGLIARQSAAAISGVLVWWLVVESLLYAFLDQRLSRFLPFVAGNGLLPLDDPAASIETLNATLSNTENALVFGGYATLALTIGTVLLCRRDNNE